MKKIPSLNNIHLRAQWFCAILTVRWEVELPPHRIGLNQILIYDDEYHARYQVRQNVSYQVYGGLFLFLVHWATSFLKYIIYLFRLYVKTYFEIIAIKKAPG